MDDGHRELRRAPLRRLQPARCRARSSAALRRGDGVLRGDRGGGRAQRAVRRARGPPRLSGRRRHRLGGPADHPEARSSSGATRCSSAAGSTCAAGRSGSATCRPPGSGTCAGTASSAAGSSSTRRRRSGSSAAKIRQGGVPIPEHRDRRLDSRDLQQPLDLIVRAADRQAATALAARLAVDPLPGAHDQRDPGRVDELAPGEVDQDRGVARVLERLLRAVRPARERCSGPAHPAPRR